MDTAEALIALGLARDDAERAVADDRVALALVEQYLCGDQRWDPSDAAARSGLSDTFLAQFNQALGLPAEQPFSDQDVDDLRLVAALLEAVSPEALLRAVRADAQGLQRIAFTTLELVNDEFIEPLRTEGAGEVPVALALAEAARSLLPVAGAMIGSSYRRILTALLSSELVAATARSSRVHLAVGFVDVVGYTSLSARVDPADLDEVLSAFERRCLAVARDPDVQLVKFLGDAAMFVALAPARLAGALLAVVGVDEDGHPPTCAGMAAGEVLLRSGDVFGLPVNLAARLTDRARPGTLLADEELADALDGGFRVRRIPSLHVRGVGRRRPLRVDALPA
jgi:adenylate cyclase